MYIYRGKPVMDGFDVAAISADKEEFIRLERKLLRVNPELGQFFTAKLAKELSGAKRGTAKYKKVYARLSSKLQYMKKKGLVVNIRYGVWQYVGATKKE